MKSREATLQERITFLQDLHRPLEEHWSHTFNIGLNPRTSDYMYKHHITHLEDIYLNHKFDISKKSHQVIQTPVTQLYGINGLKSNLPKQKGREKEKESGWVANFHKYQALEPKRCRRPRIKPPIVRQEKKAASAQSETPSDHIEYNPLEVSEEDLAAEQQMLMRRRTRAPDLTSDELVMLGMYKLNPEQEEIYQKFVSMLTEFDKYDMRSIIEDAFEDAQSDGILQEYGGIDLPDRSDRKA